MKSVAFVLVLGALCAAENVHQTKPGLTATLQCGIADSSSSLQWLKGDERLLNINPKTGMSTKGKVELAKRSRVKNDKDLEISKITPNDAGPFSCTASGRVEQHRLVVASASVSPAARLEVGAGAVLQCDVAGLPQGAAAVEWVGPGGGRRERTSRLSVAAVTLADAGPWECVFSAGGKTMKETVTLQVTEPRPKATTTPSTTKTTERTGKPCPDCDASPTHAPPALSGLSWWVWAAVGGGCLVVLLWVLILVMYNRMARRRRRFMKMRQAAQMRPKQYCQCPGGHTAAAGLRGQKPSAPPLAAPLRTAP